MNEGFFPSEIPRFSLIYGVKVGTGLTYKAQWARIMIERYLGSRGTDRGCNNGIVV